MGKPPPGPAPPPPPPAPSGVCPPPSPPGPRAACAPRPPPPAAPGGCRPPAEGGPASRFTCATAFPAPAAPRPAMAGFFHRGFLPQPHTHTAFCPHSPQYGDDGDDGDEEEWQVGAGQGGSGHPAENSFVTPGMSRISVQSSETCRNRVLRPPAVLCWCPGPVLQSSLWIYVLFQIGDLLSGACEVGTAGMSLQCTSSRFGLSFW